MGLRLPVHAPFEDRLRAFQAISVVVLRTILIQQASLAIVGSILAGVDALLLNKGKLLSMCPTAEMHRNYWVVYISWLI